MKLCCRDIYSDSVRDTDDIKKEPNLFMKPKQSLRETGQKQQHTRVCVPDTAAQMIGNANNDSCRIAAIVPYKERLAKFNNCSCLHLENLVPCTSSYFVHIPVFHREEPTSQPIPPPSATVLL